ncbi:MFS transporter [Klebsiella pneumoniae]|uniref:MFS transporter n=1 Tax=Klebsiella pneumoniae TaxID=573 RepID=UPI000E2B16EA|nr:MFS transporter [Klebsiella pneumoniae]SWH09111.1 multidrug resistance protein D [Klebsiella pneumoniae]SWH29280.1 multidrug resistance protein D [Klebsiella pneumoniae]SWH46571.1 multidrug resistance protein D [Klebsiella pneumoniae]SWR88278.1 multidrug resistance protein D [Klebsiella pneumoniae]VUG21867.1 multidrug resistance protein D [Klebsiella pneumoniae]
MKRHKNFNLLLMLVLLVAVGQMAQTIYIPAIADMAVALNVREGAVQSVMARTLPRDLYEGAQLRHANSLLNMGILVSPLIAPLLGGILDTLWSWRACYAFLLVLCAGVTFSMAKWMPETRPEGAPRTKLLASYKTLFGTGAFNCYLLMLIGGLAGIAVFEACSGVLMGAVLGLSSMAVSILFILPIPAAFFGAWFAGRPNKRFPTLMWQSVICCLLAGLMMWIPGLLGIMTVWTLLVPAALFFFGAGMLFPLATSGAMEPFPFLAGTAGALVGGLQNIGSGVLAWLSAMMPQTGQGSLGLLMMLMGLLILLCWLPLASRFTHHQQPV